MKTLDEVIKIFDEHVGYTINKPDDVFRSALHYLKEYKEHMDIQEFKDLCHAHNQAKLSWLQLQEMFGKPVYYVNNENDRMHGWIIVYELHITEKGQFVMGTNDCYYPMKDYRFYRREYV